MSGLYDAGPQPGGRRPAPRRGRLALVQAFETSFRDLRERRSVDHFATRAGLAEWLEERGLDPGAVSDADLRRAIGVRDGLRSLLAKHNGAPRDAPALRDAAHGLPVAVCIDRDGRTWPVVLGQGVKGALGLIMADVRARANGTWERREPDEDGRTRSRRPSLMAAASRVAACQSSAAMIAPAPPSNAPTKAQDIWRR